MCCLIKQDKVQRCESFSHIVLSYTSIPYHRFIHDFFSGRIQDFHEGRQHRVHTHLYLYSEGTSGVMHALRQHSWGREWPRWQASWKVSGFCQNTTYLWKCEWVGHLRRLGSLWGERVLPCASTSPSPPPPKPRPLHKFLPRFQVFLR